MLVFFLKKVLLENGGFLVSLALLFFLFFHDKERASFMFYSFLMGTKCITAKSFIYDSLKWEMAIDLKAGKFSQYRGLK